MRLLVIGGSGSVGRKVVEAALQKGYDVRVLTRHASNRLSSQVDVILGDLTDVATLAGAVEGVDAIVFTHGTYGGGASAEAVDYGGVRNVLQALGQARPRLALMTTIGVTDRKGSHDWKRRAERLVRGSGLEYTIVRPGWFDYNDPDELSLVLRQGDRSRSGTPRDGVVSRHQLGAMLVHCLTSPAALRKTFELVAVKGPETTDMDALLAGLDPDDEGFVDGAHDASNMPMERVI